ncbi:MAG: hypothetical protein Ct9H300mP32_2480 [Verrucomicrobiota bacterium]|nr:MAG: hypothetical protein Ct9H300mP32_2480 [Verrucomicrobiota bacterium]
MPVGKISASTSKPTPARHLTPKSRPSPDPCRCQVLHRDRRFLGDKYIGVIPGANELPPLNDGATVACEEPFDLVRTARSATDLIDELKVVATQVTNIVNRIDRSCSTNRLSPTLLPA